MRKKNIAFLIAFCFFLCFAVSTVSATTFPETCDERCLACGYLSGLCRLDGCHCNEVMIGAVDCAVNETCCCLKSLEPCPTATPMPTPPKELSDIIEILVRPFELLGEYLQRVFFYTPFMPDEINQTREFPFTKIANKPLESCISSVGECHIQQDDNFSILIAYTEGREEMWAEKEFISITIYDVDGHSAWAKMDILVINLGVYFEVPQPKKWAVGDEAFWHYLFKFGVDADEASWLMGMRVWWLVLVAVAVVIGTFGVEKRVVKKRRGRR